MNNQNIRIETLIHLRDEALNNNGYVWRATFKPVVGAGYGRGGFSQAGVLLAATFPGDIAFCETLGEGVEIVGSVEAGNRKVRREMRDYAAGFEAPVKAEIASAGHGDEDAELLAQVTCDWIARLAELVAPATDDAPKN